MTEPSMVWVDVETTGLNPREGWLLEVGMIATDADLNELSRSSWVQHFDRDNMPHIADEALKMHTASGLLFEAIASRETKPSIEASILQWLDSRVGYSLMKRMPMAGSTVQFDRAWLAQHLPGVEKHFHYRNVDVSTVKNLARLWYPTIPGWHTVQKLHRALPDLEESIAELAFYRQEIFGSQLVVLDKNGRKLSNDAMAAIAEGAMRKRVIPTL